MVCYLFIGSWTFSSVFALLGGQAVVEQFILSLNMSPTQFLILTQAIIFLLGWPLEWTEIIIIFVPIFLPLLDDFGIDPDLLRHPGGAEHANRLQYAAGGDGGLLPEGRGAAARASSPTSSAGALPFVFMVFMTMALVYIFPGIALWLPDYLYRPR